MLGDFYLWGTQQVAMLSMYFTQILFSQISHQSIWLLGLTEQRSVILKQQECSWNNQSLSIKKCEVLESQLCSHVMYICLSWIHFLSRSKFENRFVLHLHYLQWHILAHASLLLFSVSQCCVYFGTLAVETKFWTFAGACYETVPLNPKWRTQKQQAGFKQFDI